MKHLEAVQHHHADSFLAGAGNLLMNRAIPKYALAASTFSSLNLKLRLHHDTTNTN